MSRHRKKETASRSSSSSRSRVSVPTRKRWSRCQPRSRRRRSIKSLVCHPGKTDPITHLQVLLHVRFYAIAASSSSETRKTSQRIFFFFFFAKNRNSLWRHSPIPKTFLNIFLLFCFKCVQQQHSTFLLSRHWFVMIRRTRKNSTSMLCARPYERLTNKLPAAMCWLFDTPTNKTYLWGGRRARREFCFLVVAAACGRSRLGSRSNSASEREGRRASRRSVTAAKRETRLRRSLLLLLYYIDSLLVEILIDSSFFYSVRCFFGRLASAAEMRNQSEPI